MNNGNIVLNNGNIVLNNGNIVLNSGNIVLNNGNIVFVIFNVDMLNLIISYQRKLNCTNCTTYKKSSWIYPLLFISIAYMKKNE